MIEDLWSPDCCTSTEVFGQHLIAASRQFEKIEKTGELVGDAEELKCVSDGSGIDDDLVEFRALQQVGDREQGADFCQSGEGSFQKCLDFFSGEKSPLFHQFGDRFAIILKKLLESSTGINLPD